MSIVGYARNNNADQVARPDAHKLDLLAAGAVKAFAERSRASRLGRALPHSWPRACDVLTVTNPDRLARHTGELLGVAADLMGLDMNGQSFLLIRLI